MATSAYEEYLNTGRIGPAPAAAGQYAPQQQQQQQQQAPVQLPAYPAAVEAAVAQAQADGKPVTPELLDTLPDAYWTRNVPLFSQHGLGKTKMDHEEAQAAFDLRAREYNAKYLADRIAKQPAGASTADGFYDKLGEGAKDFGQVVLTSAGQLIGQASRLAGGGLAEAQAPTGSWFDTARRMYDVATGDLEGAGKTTQEAYWDAHKKIFSPEVEKSLQKYKEQAEQRSPIAGGFVGNVAAQIGSFGQAGTFDELQKSIDNNESLKQQYTGFGLNTGINTAGIAIPLGGSVAKNAVKAVAGRGLASGTAKNVLRSEIGKSSQLVNMAKYGGINAGLGGAQTVGMHLISPERNPLSADNALISGALGMVLAGVHFKITRSSALKMVERLEPAKVNADGSVTMVDPKTKQTFNAPKGSPVAEAAMEAGMKPEAAPTAPFTMPEGTRVEPYPGDGQVPDAATEVMGVQPDGSTVVRDAVANHVYIVPKGDQVPGQPFQTMPAGGGGPVPAGLPSIPAAKTAGAPAGMPPAPSQQAPTGMPPVPSGSGVADTTHGTTVSAVAQQAASASRRAKVRYDGMPAEARLDALMTDAAGIAENTSGDQWVQFSPSQQAQAIAGAARALERGTRVPGVEEAVHAIETAAAKPVVAPDMGGLTGEAPQVRTASSSESPNEASLQFMMTHKMRGDLRARGYSEEAIGKMRPQEAQAILDEGVSPVTEADAAGIAEEAMSDSKPASPLSGNVPDEAGARTRAQASSPDEIALHARADEQLLAAGVRNKGQLEVMPYRRKLEAIENVLEVERAEARMSKRSDKDFTPERKAMHDAIDAELVSLRRNVLGRAPSKATLAKMDLGAKEELLAELQQTQLSEGATPKKAEAPARGNAPEPNETPSANDPVGDVLHGKVTDNDLTDVRALVENAREGDGAPLATRVNEMLADGQITAAEARVLRKAARERAPNPSEREAGKPSESPLDDGPVEKSELGRAAEEIDGISVEMLSVDPLKSDLARAAELITKLRRRFANSEPHKKTIDMLQWLLDKNPALVRNVKGIGVAGKDAPFSGRFSPLTRILTLASKEGIPISTAVHEILHAAESMLPPAIRNAIRAAWRVDVRAMRASAAKAEAAFFEYMDNALSAKTPSERRAYQNAAKEEMIELRRREDISAERVRELYPLTNPSEFWAVNASHLLAEGFANRSVAKKAQEWLKGFIDQLRTLLGGTKNRDSIVEGLEHVLRSKETGTGGFLRDYELMKGEFSGQPEAFSPMANAEPLHNLVVGGSKAAYIDDDPITKRTVMRAFLSTVEIGFERLDELARRLSLELPSLRETFTTLPALREYFRKVDANDVVEPIKHWVAQNSVMVDRNPKKAIEKLGEFMQAHHQVNERMPQVNWAEKVPLENGMEGVRDSIIQQAADAPDLATAQAAMAKLRPLAEKHASVPMEKWFEQTSGDYYASMQRRLKELADEGVTERFMAPLNKLVQTMEERTYHRRIESGDIAPDDFMARARGYKWSTPQKGGKWDGAAHEAAELQTNELTNLRYQSEHLFTRPQDLHASQLQTAEGRADWAENTLIRSLTDLGNAGTNAANKRMLSFIHDLVEDTQGQIAKRLKTETDPRIRAQLEEHELNRTTVDAFTGTPFEGWTNVATGKHLDRLPTPERSVIHHDGRNQYLIQFPKDSKMLFSLEAMGTKVDWREMPFFKASIEFSEAIINAPVHAVNKLAGTKFADQTHLITRANRNFAQLLTVFKPVWNVTTLFPRSVYEKVMMLAIREGDGVTDSMRLGFESLSNMISGTLKPGTGKALAMLWAQDHAGLIKLGEANPDSWAGSWLELNREGGGNVFTQGLSMSKDTNALVTAIKESNYNVLQKGLHGYAHYSRGLADMLENVSSVGAYRALRKRGMDPRTSAVKIKQLLDFQKKGMAGDMLNGMHAFYRITASVNDTMYQVFRHPMGKHEQEIMGFKFKSAINHKKLAAVVMAVGSYAGMKYMLDRSLMGKDENGVSNMRKAIAQNPAMIVQRSFIPNPKDPSKPYMLPVGLGFPQILSVPGKLLAALAYNDITPEQARQISVETFQRNMSIVEPAGTPEDADASTKAFAYALQALMPTIGQQANALFSNMDSLGRNIHTAHAVDSKFAADQGKPNTPQEWKDAAQTLHGITGLDYYPETLQFTAQTFGGPLNDLMRITISDDARARQGLERKGAHALTGTKNFGAEYYDSKRMYSLIDELQETKRQLGAVEGRSGSPATSPEAKAAGQRWLSSNPKAQRKIAALKMLEKAQRTYRDRIKAISNSNYADEGRILQRKSADSALRRATDEAERMSR